MDFKKANRVSKRLCKQYGIIEPPAVLPLPYSRIGKRVGLGYYEKKYNEVGLNKYIMELWPDEPIIETIKHELMHCLCHQEYGESGHGRHFKELCKKHGIDEDTMLATKRERN